MVPRIYSQNRTLRLGILLLCLFGYGFSFGQAPPVFNTCPGTATLTLPAGGGNITFTNTNIPALLGVMASDPDAAEAVTYSASPASIGCGDIGVIPITVDATDSDGTTNCTITNVTIVDGGPLAMSLATFDAVLDPAGNVTVSTTDLDNGSSSCSGAHTLSILETANFMCAEAGTTVTLTLQAMLGGQTSTSTTSVTIVDNMTPVLTCPANQSLNNAAGTCGASATVIASATDNCTATITNDFNAGGADASGTYPVGTTTVTFTATDGTNTSTCTVDITVTDTENPVLTVPANQSVSNDAGTCGAAVTVIASATDNCTATITNDFNAGGADASGTYPVGTTTVTFTATDGTNTVMSTTDVTINDTEAPTVATTTSNITMDNDMGDCSASITYTAPTFNDNCDGMGLAGTLTAGLASGAAFPVGTTTVTYSYTDAAGNGTVTSSFDVTVNDTEAPDAAAVNPGNMTVNNDAGVCQATVSWPSVSSADNCSGLVTVVYSATDPKSGTVNILTAVQGGVLVDFGDFPVGTTTVTYTITDAATPANSDMGSFTVTVEDNEAPMITCPSTQTLHYANCDAMAMIPDYRGLGNITDNCPQGYTVTQSPAPGTLLSAVATPANGEMIPITITVTDNSASASNLGTSCIFMVVLDEDNTPVPSTAGTILPALNGQCGPLTVVAPTAFDECGNLICGEPFPPIATDLGVPCVSASGPCTTNSRTSSDTPIATVDNSTITSTITIPASTPALSVDDINVVLDISHTWVGDLEVTLTSPSGTQVTLFDRPAIPGSTFGCAGDDLNVTFDDAATLTNADLESTCNNSPAIAGTFQPEVPLAMFNGENPEGDWVLSVTDNAGGDGGNLNSWTLDICENSSSTTISEYEFPVGTHNITWVFDDGNGNTVSQLQQIMVTDDIQGPTFNCQDFTVQLDANGLGTLTAADVLESASISLTSGDDGSGNLGTTSYSITVPTSTTYSFDWTYTTADPGFEAFGYILNGTQNILAASSNSGTSSVTVAAGDVFEFLALTADNTFGPGTATISNFSPGFSGSLGLGNWTFTNTDANGSFSSAPGEAADNCSAAADLTYALSQSSFDCTNVGANTITLTVTDEAGNPTTCNPVITVVDNIPPVFDPATLPANMVVDCDDVPAVAVGITATDNCGTVGMNFNQTSTQIGNSSLCADYSYTITRTWTATDANGNSSSHVQTINVADNEAPTFTLPTSVSMSSNQGSCQATVSLSVTAADLSDNCTPFANLTITNNAPVGNGTDDASGVYPVGSTLVTFTAEDPCGKISTHDVMVNVIDDTPPIASCKNNVVAVIPAGASQITIPAQLIDNGSFDNCAPITMSVLPMSFDCSQADGVTAWPITLVVTENIPGGQTSTCQTTIIIQDNSAPEAICKDTTLFLDVNGNASITADDINDGSFDGCSGLQSMTLLTQSNFTVADVGPNTATLAVTDINGNSDICSSTVTVAPAQTCFTVDGMIGSEFVAGTGISEVPLTTSNFINSLGFQFTLEIDESIATFVGINNVDPALNTNGILTAIPNATGDTLTVSWFNTSGTPLTLNTAQLFTVTVNVVGVVGSTTTIDFINLPTPPEFTSRYGTTIFTNPEFPPCTEDGALLVDATATLTVSGNIRTWGITTIDSIIDNSVMPADTTVITTVVVPVQNVANAVVSKTETHPGLNGGLPLFAANAATTDAAGNYTAVVSNQPGGITLDLNSSKTTPNWLNNSDVNSIDLGEIQDHIVNNVSFTSIYQYVASDVDEDGLITTLDLILIQDVILNPTASTVITDYAPWRMVPAIDSLHLLPLPGQPFAPLIDEEISFNNYTMAMTNADWIAVKIGQVTGPLNTQLLAPTTVETRTGKDLEMLIENQKIEEGEIVSIPVYAKDYSDFTSWQFTLEFDEYALSYEGIETGVLQNFGENKLGLALVEEGIIGALWFGDANEYEDDDILFTLKFKVNESAEALSGLLNVSSKTVSSLTGLKDGSMGDVKLSFFEPTQIVTNTAEFELHQNRPNPFNGKTMISFVLPESGFGKITVYDISGRVLKSIEGDFVKGYNEVSINSNDISTSGVLYYQLESAENTATKKMIILD